MYVAIMCCMAAATIVEKYKGSDFVADRMYGAWWFSALWAVLAVCGVAWIWHCRKRMNAPVVVLHASLIAILCGACITHLTRWQGITTIRIGGKTDTVVATQGKLKGYEQKLGFTIRLNDFDVATHEGTDAAADYISNITVSDGQSSDDMSIAMNHPAKTHGVTIMQMGFDADRLGSTLAVNSDPWGTPVTYTGYALLFLSVVWMLLGRRSTFRRLLGSRILREYSLAVVAAFAMAGMSPSAAAEVPHSLPHPTAEAMGKLLIMHNGRICPMQTYALDFTRKVYGSSAYEGLSAMQVVTGWMFWGDEWAAQPFIKTGSHVSNTLMIDRHNAMNRFFNASMGGYILGPYVQEYYAGQHDKFHSDAIAVDERIQLIMQLRGGESLHLFPLTAKGSTKWLSPTDHVPSSAPKEYAAFIRGAITLMHSYAASGDIAAIDGMVQKLAALQRRDGGKSLPTDTQVSAELAYNAVPFNTVLFIINLTMGFVMLFVNLKRIGRRQQSAHTAHITRVARILPTAVMALSLSTLTVFCVLRWIVSGTIPMANGFETMLFVAWTVMLVSLLCSRRMPIVLTFGFIMSGFFLLVSHISQMDPQISHVMPVLNSPLLSIHVSVIMFAFALLSITFICGVTALAAHLKLTLAARKGRHDDDTADNRLLETYSVLSRVFLYPAIAALAIGIFVGAIWAERSWGEYWGWDPKETWALITLMIYAIPLHTSTVSGLRKPMRYHVFMTLAFLAIIMTYFGVNYFLGGMHSYA